MQITRVHQANHEVHGARKMWLARHRDNIGVVCCTIEQLIRARAARRSARQQTVSHDRRSGRGAPGPGGPLVQRFGGRVASSRGVIAQLPSLVGLAVTPCTLAGYLLFTFAKQRIPVKSVVAVAGVTTARFLMVSTGAL